MNFIKSYIAQRNWLKAHSLLANQSPDMALIAIVKAIKVEPNDAKKQKYLKLKNHIESTYKLKLTNFGS